MSRALSPQVLDLRSAEQQAAAEDLRLLNENNSGPAAPGEPARRAPHELPHTELPGQAPYTLNFSFEELNTLGLEEGAPRHSNLSWQVRPPRGLGRAGREGGLVCDGGWGPCCPREGRGRSSGAGRGERRQESGRDRTLTLWFIARCPTAKACGLAARPPLAP